MKTSIYFAMAVQKDQSITSVYIVGLANSHIFTVRCDSKKSVSTSFYLNLKSTVECPYVHMYN